MRQCNVSLGQVEEEKKCRSDDEEVVKGSPAWCEVNRAQPRRKRRKGKDAKWTAKLKHSEEAASRCLRGDGCNPSLPPLQGLSTSMRHPYGVLPYGNIYCAENVNGDAVRMRGLGPLLRVLNDEQVSLVLSFLDGTCVSRWVQCSRFCYVAGHQWDVWRDITLRWLDRQGATPLTTFNDTWKDTYISLQTNSPAKPHKPLLVNGVYSDFLYRAFLCRSFDLDQSTASNTKPSHLNNVPTEDARNLTTQQFILKYEQPNKPCILTHATDTWPAYHNWPKPQYLKQHTQNTTFRATSGAAPLPANFTMDGYLQYCQSQDAKREEAPLYLFDRTFRDKAPTLLQDYQPHLHKTAPFFSSSATNNAKNHHHDLFRLLGPTQRPDYSWIILGPQRSGSSFHIDPNATHAWNAPIVGRKRWIFYPPGVPPPGVLPSPDGDDVCMPISIGEWYLSYYKQHLQQRNHPDPHKRPLECTVSPGQILFVPHGWWHTVINIDEGYSVALTQNYVSGTNLPDVLRFLKFKEGQISGCRDRPEAIAPENLLQVFKERLNEYNVQLLDKAEKEAAQGWSCRAWTDLPSEQNQHAQGQDGQGAGSTFNKKETLWERAKGPTFPLQSKSQEGDYESSTKEHKTQETLNGSSSKNSSGFTFSFL